MKLMLINRSAECGYRSYLNVCLPYFQIGKFREIFLSKSTGMGRIIKAELNTMFILTSSVKHVLIKITLLGFGFEFFVKTN